MSFFRGYPIDAGATPQACYDSRAPYVGSLVVTYSDDDIQIELFKADPGITSLAMYRQFKARMRAAGYRNLRKERRGEQMTESL
ncbi:hypothetical protein [Hahella ganghwensis]|uniref:hypothetical protein n=1 Tax=Hahella ganghwensis TaxID=286420 RepID=UPI00039A1CA9|nr:hypothetical protein [Hahella ganghwensis]